METFKGTLDIYYASAGTGKSTTLLNMLEKHMSEGVQPERIAFVTFTRAGAEVGRMRTAERFGIPLKRLTLFRTIHSLAFKGMKASSTQMMDEKKYKDFGEQAGYDFSGLSLNAVEGVDWAQMQDNQLVHIEQLYRNNPKYCEKIMDARVEYSQLTQYISLYAKYKEIFKYYDFTDLLEKYISNNCFEDVDVVCLDEMQDSSPLQWRMVFQAFHSAKHMYIAGDYKQGIYSFSGADSSVLLKLKGNLHLLETSYRVPSVILDYTQHNIVDNMLVTDGSHCESSVQGGKVDYISTSDELDLIFEPSKSYFFLCRNKRFYSYFEKWCQERGLPYSIKGIPYFSDQDKFEYREGKTTMWDAKKLDFARYCFSQGTFYNGPKINISTIHGVKGDEADIVVLVSDISKATASQLDIDEDSEHKVFYVACTRAKEKLYIMQPQTKLFYPYLF